jgi:hypothetical protein
LVVVVNENLGIIDSRGLGDKDSAKFTNGMSVMVVLCMEENRRSIYKNMSR